MNQTLYATHVQEIGVRFIAIASELHRRARSTKELIAEAGGGTDVPVCEATFIASRSAY